MSENTKLIRVTASSSKLLKELKELEGLPTVAMTLEVILREYKLLKYKE